MIINSHIINASPGEAGTPTIIQGTLPSAYRRVLGFTLNDNAYWAITGVTLNGNDTVRISFSVSQKCNVFGCYSSSSATNNFSLYASTTSGNKYLRYGNGTYLSYFSSSNLNRRFDVVMSGTGTSGMPTDSSWTQLSFTGTETFCIGTTATDSTSTKLVGNLYGDVAVDGKFYGVPCERISDNKLGYYDVISETFFAPTGSGVISLGYDAAITLSPVVTNTTGYITGGTIEGNPTTISASDLVSGTKNLTNTSVTDVTNYANAQIVDSNLTAANIANGVTVLGITGTHQGGITPTGTIQISSTDSSNPDDVTNYAGAYVAAGTAGTPTATKGTVSNHSVSVTPSVTNTTGYITGSTKTGTSVSVSASELVSGTLNITNTSAADVTNYASAQVVDSNLVAGNIKKDVNILGVTGTYEGSGGAALITETENEQGGITQEISVVNVLHVGSKTITQNGTYDPADDNYDAYSSVTVNVSGGGGGITQYITFTATLANTRVSITQTGTSYGTWTFKYSTDNTNWNNYTVGTDITLSAIGDYVSFAGIDNYATVQDSNNYKRFIVGAGGVNVSGKLAGFYGQNIDYAGEYAYYQIFYNQTKIYDISNLIMPSGAIHSYALYGCFKNCTQLETPCALPAMVLAPYAYSQMFYGCTKLTSCPALPATTLNSYCYGTMFRGCTALTATMSSLPATIMKSYSYSYMFYGCTALKTHCSLSATTVATGCYESMFYGCDALETIAALPATTLVTNCYKSMYSHAAGIKVSTTQTGDYQNAWRIPTSGTGTTTSGWNGSMLASTGGTFTGDPVSETTYYTSNTVV